MFNSADSAILAAAGIDQDEYLAYLSERVPQNLPALLTRDAHPDLMLDDHVELNDLIRPLSTRSFFDNDRSRIAQSRLISVLEHALRGYAIDRNDKPTTEDAFKQIYVASFYLYGCLRLPLRSRAYADALNVLVSASTKLESDGQVQVARFLASLIPFITEESSRYPASTTLALLALSSIVLQIVDNLSLLLQRTAKREHFVDNWCPDSLSRDSDQNRSEQDRVDLLKNALLAFVKPAGIAEQATNRFNKAIESRS